jgi:hypothetical protein
MENQVLILYSSSTQINAVVPFITGSTAPRTAAVLRGGGEVIWRAELPVGVASPGLFTHGAGYGQLTALNEAGSLNSADNPASPGSVVSVFLTGAGVYDRPIDDGAPGPMEPPFPSPVLGLGASIWSGFPSVGTPATVLFAGQAPGLIAGIVQVKSSDSRRGEARRGRCSGARGQLFQPYVAAGEFHRSTLINTGFARGAGARGRRCDRTAASSRSHVLARPIFGLRGALQ